jgi:hypothetical protein
MPWIPVEPLAGRHRLPRVRVVSEAAPITTIAVVQRLVGNRTLDYEDERFKLAAVGLVEPLDEHVSARFRPGFEVDERPVNGNLWQAGNSS